MLIRTMRAHVALVVSMLSACTSGSGGPQVSPSPPGITPTASASFVGLRSVVVSVSGIEGEAGGQLAGILFEGRETSYPGFHPLGGFAASVDATRTRPRRSCANLRPPPSRASRSPS